MCFMLLSPTKPSVRKTHNNGRKHKENVKFYYTKWMEEQAQNLIDQTSKWFLTATRPWAKLIQTRYTVWLPGGYFRVKKDRDDQQKS